MEFLKPIFGDGSLTYAELEAKLKEKNIKPVDLQSGLYVDKGKLSDKEAELKAANKSIAEMQDALKKFDGVDVEGLKSELEALQGKYDDDIKKLKLESALDIALLNAKAHDAKAVKPFLDTSIIKMDGDKLIGLDEQLAALQKEKGFLFAGQTDLADGESAGGSSAFVNTGNNHGSDLLGGDDAFIAAVKQSANLTKETK